MKYLFSNILGIFVFDNQFNLVEESRFKRIEEHQERDKVEKGLKQKYKDWKEVPGEKEEKILAFFKDKKYFGDFYNLNLELTKSKIRGAVSEDLLIIQTVSSLRELDKVSNLLSKRLREWHGYCLPEFSEKVGDNKKFVELVVKKERKELLEEMGLSEKESMGAKLEGRDREEMRRLGKEILNLYELREKEESYLKEIMKRYCPNILELAGATIGGELIELGKGLKHLALLPASTIQLLGAEKALFRHLKTGSPSPKFGVIHSHQLVQKAKKEDKGKMARALADKLVFCVRLDFFRGEFKAPDYRKELENKLKEYH